METNYNPLTESGGVLTLLSKVISFANISDRINDEKAKLSDEEKEGLKRFVRTWRAGSNTIAKRASENIAMYPVILSSTISNKDAFLITKFLELHYAVFTMAIAGMSSIISKDSSNVLGDHISKMKILTNKNKFLSYFSRRSNRSLYEKYEFLGEPGADQLKEADDNAIVPYNANDTGANSTQSGSTNEESPRDDKEPEKIDSKQYKRRGSLPTMSPAQIDKLESKLSDAHPTIITLKIQMAEIGGPIEVPIAIKSTPHFVMEEEMSHILSQLGDMSKRKLLRFIKVLTGEKRFILDYILHLDKAKKDKDMLKIVNRHPWIRKLGIEKTKRLFSAAIGSSNFVAPNISVVCQMDEMVAGLGISEEQIIDGSQHIFKALRSAHMLAAVVFIPDESGGSAVIYFNGLSNPIFVSTSTMQKSGRNAQSDMSAELAKINSQLVRKI